MLICFFDTEGIVHKEFVPPGQMMNGKFYWDVLRQMRENIQTNGKHPWALHHDNALAHALLTVWQFSPSTNTTVICHPPCSLDHTTCDFFLFPKMKLKLKKQRFDSTEGIQTKSQDVMKMLT